MMDAATTYKVNAILEDFPNLDIQKEKYGYFEKKMKHANESYVVVLMNFPFFEDVEKPY